MAGIKRDKRDDVFSKLVRERANWTCEICGKYYPEGNRQGLHCSHFFGRRQKSMRWTPDNAASHCYSCHQHMGANPLLFSAWIKKHLGSGRLELLEERRNQLIKYTKTDLEDIYQHLRAELKRLQELRADGETGRLEFAAFD